MAKTKAKYKKLDCFWAVSSQSVYGDGDGVPQPEVSEILKQMRRRPAGIKNCSTYEELEEWATTEAKPNEILLLNNAFWRAFALAREESHFGITDEQDGLAQWHLPTGMAIGATSRLRSEMKLDADQEKLLDEIESRWFRIGQEYERFAHGHDDSGDPKMVRAAKGSAMGRQKVIEKKSSRKQTKQEQAIQELRRLHIKGGRKRRQKTNIIREMSKVNNGDKWGSYGTLVEYCKHVQLDAGE